VQLVDTDDMMDEMSEIVDGPRRTSACRIGAITGLVLVFIGAVLVASKIGFTMESPKTTSSSNAVISEDISARKPSSRVTCLEASQKWEDKIGYTDCSQYWDRDQKIYDWPRSFITHYPDTNSLSPRLIWRAHPGDMCMHNYKEQHATSLEDCVKKCMAQQGCIEFSYHKTWPSSGQCRTGNKKPDGATGLRCVGNKYHEKCDSSPSACVLYKVGW